MAYYRLSQVIKMRREALGHNRHEYDVEGPSGMTVYRMEKGEVHASEKTYRKLTRAMGEEESTRRGILKTKDIRVLWLTNEIADSILSKDYEKAEELIKQLEKRLDCEVKRNQRYLDIVKTKLHYRKGKLEGGEYERIIYKELSYRAVESNCLIEQKWPFKEREWNQLLELVEISRREKNYKKQKKLLEQMREIIEIGYIEQEYKTVYMVYVQYRLGDVLGNIGLHREAIKMDEEAIRLCEERTDWRYVAKLYYDIFWNFWTLKKKETLTEQEEARCRECLLRAYYLSKALSPENKLYEKRVRECYPEVLC